MIPSAFEYARATSLDEALALLVKHGEGSKILAGGHSLVPMMKLRLAEPSVLIDIGGIAALSGIAFDGKRFVIGATTKHAALAASDELRRHAPVLWEAANQLGDPQVRNRGTVGGACANGDPSCDYAAVMFALDATFGVVGSGSRRDDPAGVFQRGMFETSLRPGELLASMSFDAAPHSAYQKYHHPASHYAMVGVAVVLELEAGAIASARVGVTGVGEHAYRAGGVEKALVGVRPSDQSAVAAACAGAAAGVEVRSDTEASATYRAAMTDVFTARAVLAAAGR
jgi:carbon-monoxide dehydrogenase medium subunit